MHEFLVATSVFVVLAGRMAACQTSDDGQAARPARPGAVDLHEVQRRAGGKVPSNYR
jgi:hypothetical protein